MCKVKWFLLGIFCIAFVLRIMYCWGLPLSGDESISLLQAAGKAVVYRKHIPTQPTPTGELQALMKYSPEYGVKTVLESMEKGGMHPPAYYLFLHYIMKYFGNSTILMRLISVFFASLSVLILFFIGRKMAGIVCGFFAALFLAVSTYGVHFALLVRPYPLVMLLSLLSTWFLILFLKNSGQKKRFYYGCFLLSVILALYSIYLFAFVFLFQIAFLILFEPRNRRNYLTAAVTCGVAFLLYLPWIPRFLNQLRVVRGGTFYFDGKSSLIGMFRFLFSYNFSEFLPGTYAWYKFLILALVLAVGALGVVQLWKSRLGRTFLMSTVIYVLGYYLADLLLGMKTLNAIHFMFFLAPVIFFLLASGVHFLWKRPVLSILSGTFLCLILAFNLFNSFGAPRTHDGPHCSQDFSRSINSLCDNSNGLILINNPTRRLVLSMVSPLQDSVDVIWARDSSYCQTLEALEKPSFYDWLFIPIYKLRGDNFVLNDQALQALKEDLGTFGYDKFDMIKDPISEETKMYIFQNQHLRSQTPKKTIVLEKDVENE